MESLKERIESLQLPSVVEIITSKVLGDFQPQSIDLPTSPGTVLMLHESKLQLEGDMQKIRAAEDDVLNGLYVLSTKPRVEGIALLGGA